MRLGNEKALPLNVSEEAIIRKVLAVDGFVIQNLNFKDDTVKIIVTNTKFRSTAQAVGRVSSTLQRFTSNNIRFANISFFSRNIITGSYRVDLEKITEEQFNPVPNALETSSIRAIDLDAVAASENSQRFTWGLGPYVTPTVQP